MLAPTDLTDRQISRLEALSKTEPLAKVVGWSHYLNAPVIRRVDGNDYFITQRGTLKLLTEYYIDSNGEIKPADAEIWSDRGKG